MTFTEILPILDILVDPTSVLSFLGVFSLLAKTTDWPWLDNMIKALEKDPGVVKKGLMFVVKLVNAFGLTKKLR